MTREDAVERLCDVYGGSFDITRCEEAELPLAAKDGLLCSTTPNMCCLKKAKLWEPTALNMCICSPFRT